MYETTVEILQLVTITKTFIHGTIISQHISKLQLHLKDRNEAILRLYFALYKLCSSQSLLFRKPYVCTYMKRQKGQIYSLPVSSST